MVGCCCRRSLKKRLSSFFRDLCVGDCDIPHDEKIGSTLLGTKAHQTGLDEFADPPVQLHLLHHEVPSPQERLSVLFVHLVCVIKVYTSRLLLANNLRMSFSCLSNHEANSKGMPIALTLMEIYQYYCGTPSSWPWAIHTCCSCPWCRWGWGGPRSTWTCSCDRSSSISLFGVSTPVRWLATSWWVGCSVNLVVFVRLSYPSLRVLGCWGRPPTLDPPEGATSASVRHPCPHPRCNPLQSHKMAILYLDFCCCCCCFFLRSLMVSRALAFFLCCFWLLSSARLA